MEGTLTWRRWPAALSLLAALLQRKICSRRRTGRLPPSFGHFMCCGRSIVFFCRFAVAYHLTLTGLFSCPTRVEAGPCCSDHGLQEAGELGAGREVAAFHSGHACEAHVDEFMARPLFDKVPLRAVFLTELVASLLAGCHAKAGCQPAQWRASFLKELAASLLGGVPVF